MSRSPSGPSADDRVALAESLKRELTAALTTALRSHVAEQLAPPTYCAPVLPRQSVATLTERALPTQLDSDLSGPRVIFLAPLRAVTLPGVRQFPVEGTALALVPFLTDGDDDRIAELVTVLGAVAVCYLSQVRPRGHFDGAAIYAGAAGVLGDFTARMGLYDQLGRLCRIVTDRDPDYILPRVAHLHSYLNRGWTIGHA